MGNGTEEIQVESTVRSLSDLPVEEQAFRDEPDDDPHVDAQGLPPDLELESAPQLEAVQQWRVAKALLALREQVNELAPRRKKESDGTIGDQHHCGSGGGTSDHCPRVRDGGVGVVTAMDITHDPANGCSAETIVNAIWASRDPRIKYLIWNRKIANSSAIGAHAPWTWRPYSGSNPHSRHFHLSVKSERSHYDSTAAWTLPGTPVS
ncbi:hypothetical protein ACUSIJ_21825 [Pseudochelatococcus sp. B33]